MISDGTALGPYRIVAAIGAGGMGEVYKATDTRLNRTVAIKVLPSQFSENPEMKQRFEREAQAIAGLNHPHICTLHDVGNQDGVHYLVMEYLDGETLAERIVRGPLPVDEVLKVAVEMADALDKAHRKGVVHRDLKPSNVMLTRTGTKLLDFGLAKLRQTGATGSVSAFPTRDDVTAQGTILGTIQYMSPEQLEGREADARSDIFAFGAVLYEMTTGKRAFEGKGGQASLISAIMTSDPQPLAKFQPMTPPALEQVVRTCLAKEPDQRWQTIHDVMVQLKWIAEAGSAAGIPVPVSTQRRKQDKLFRILLAAATLLAVTMSIPAVLYFRPAPALEEIRFDLTTPMMPGPALLSISPDGRWIAFTAFNSARNSAIFVRPIGSTALQQLAGTEGASTSFWSPDSRNLGFFAGGKLKKIAVSGGPPQDICDALGSTGGTWSEAGILFGAGGVLNRVSTEGGVPAQVMAQDEPRQEVAHSHPYFLPDGRHFLYMVTSSSETHQGIYVGSLDSKPAKRVAAEPAMPVYSNSGHLLYQRLGALFAAPFDVDKMVAMGEPVRIADQVFRSSNGRAAFAVSQTGTLILRAGGGQPATQQFVWHDRSGRVIGNAGPPGAYTANFDLSPDEKQLAVSIQSPADGGSSLWVMEWARGVTTRLQDSASIYGLGRDIVWSPDGLRLAYSALSGSNVDVVEKKSSGLGEESALFGSSLNDYVEDWSKDGRYIAYISGREQADIWAVPLFGEKKPFPVIESSFRKDEPHFSFDGKWLVYSSDETGTWQIYVLSFPAGDQKRQISTNGGVQPRWRSDGREIYYLTLDGKMMAVDISIMSLRNASNTPAKIDSGIPRLLFDTGLTLDPIRDQYAVTADGQRFLLLKPLAEGTPAPITVVLNWNASLKK